MKHQIEAPILAHFQRNAYEFEIILEAPQIAEEALPGNFVQILYDQSFNPYTRRPFSVFHSDPTNGRISILYLARGVFTKGLRDKIPGQKLSLIGPLGNSFKPSIKPDVSHILVAGGVGAPPLYFLAREIKSDPSKKCRVEVINGARTQDLLVAVDEFSELGAEVRCTTDDGSRGVKGIVTDVLKEMLEERSGEVCVYSCGPTPMLRTVGELCVQQGVNCQLSVETMMPCGMGVCMGCVVKIKDSSSETGWTYKRSCCEGPVFQADEIIWD